MGRLGFSPSPSFLVFPFSPSRLGVKGGAKFLY